MGSYTSKSPRQRRKKRRFRPLRRLLLIFIILGLMYGMFAASRAVYRLAFPAIRYHKAALVEDPILKGRAVVLREELVVAAPRAGVLNVLLDNGARVLAGQTVFELVDKNLLTAIDKQLAEEAAKATGKAAETEDVYNHKRSQLAQAQAVVRAHTVRYSNYIRLGSRLEADRVFRELEQAQQTAAKFMQEYDFASRSQEQYEARRKELLSQRQRAILSVTAPVPGIISFSTDGLESSLKASGYRNVTLSALRQVKNEQKSFKNNDVIAAGQAVCTIIDSSSAVLLLEAKSLGALPEALEVTYAGSVMPVELLSNTPTSEDKVSILALRVLSPSLEMLSRTIEVTIRARGEALCSIPARAVIPRGSGSVVYVRSPSGQIEERLVVVRSTRGKLAIVTGLNPDEVVVTTPQNLKPERSPQ